MPRDLVNVASPAPTPVANRDGARARGEGFASLVETDGRDGKKDDSSAAAIDAAVAGLFSVAAPAISVPTPGKAPDIAISGQAQAGVKAPAVTLAAALQAQADGLIAKGDADARKGAGDALAAEGVVSLKGKSEIETLTLGKPGANALDAPAKESKGQGADVDGKLAGSGTVEAKPADPKAADAKIGTGAQAAAIQQAAGKADADTSSDPGSEQQPGGEQTQRIDAARASAQTDRIQTLQTSAAPATPSAQSGQASAGANVAAGAQVAAAVQVANQIASHAASRRSRFEVQLDPGDLGRVDVRLDIGHDGRVATRLIVERPETLDMLRNDARELSRTLEQAGFQLGQGGLAFQLKDGRQAMWSADDAPSRPAAEDEIDDVAPVAAIYTRGPATGAGGVDLKV